MDGLGDGDAGRDVLEVAGQGGLVNVEAAGDFSVGDALDQGLGDLAVLAVGAHAAGFHGSSMRQAVSVCLAKIVPLSRYDSFSAAHRPPRESLPAVIFWVVATLNLSASTRAGNSGFHRPGESGSEYGPA